MILDTITNITAWISDMNPGDVKSAYLSCEKVQTLNCLASRFNRGRGVVRKIFVHYHYCSDFEVATLVCESLEDYYENNKSGNKYEWKKQIPKNYR